MQQAQRGVKQVDQVCARDSGSVPVSAFFKIQTRLDQFQVPVTKLAPEEVVNAVRSFVKAISLKRIVDIRSNAVES
jgi:hypothetical protein